MKKSNHKTRIKRFAAIMAFLGVALALVVVYAQLQEQKATRVVGGKANVKALYHFDDVNDTQITAAQRFGIEPLQSRDELDSVLLSSLVKVETSNGFCVEPLTTRCPISHPTP